jgi:prevent-host-death family protein
MFVHDPNHKGNVAELAIATEAARLGLSVLKPLTEHERYDLVLGTAGRLLRVQCKWASRQGDVITVRLKSSYHSPTRGYVTATYDDSEVDAIAVYCGDLARCYLLPISLVAGRGAVTLRLSPARNNQRAALNLAAEYEFSGAVAQLEERVAGSDEVRGSSPLSSTALICDPIDMKGTEQNRFPDLKQVVGMDEFYAKLAQYVRQAEKGVEVLVTRWGTPVARLVPPNLNPTPLAADD